MLSLWRSLHVNKTANHRNTNNVEVYIEDPLDSKCTTAHGLSESMNRAGMNTIATYLWLLEGYQIELLITKKTYISKQAYLFYRNKS